MSMASNTVPFLFRWEHPAKESVYVTGTFDDWAKTKRLSKADHGGYEIVIDLPAEEKVLYKFVVDGKWIVNYHYPLETDRYGNRLNVATPISTNENQRTEQATPPSSTRKLAPSRSSSEEPISVPNSKYTYRKLDFDIHEIRILTLKANADEDADILCDIEHESLISPRPYTALSYCWGEGELRKEISLNSHKQSTTVNLWYALQVVRKTQHQRRPGEHIRLWVDAICINQEDKQERSEQVRNMLQIYSRAQEVIAFVGRARLDFMEVAFLEHISQAALPIPGAMGSPILPAKIERSQWEALDCLFSQPYWRRVWIIQEITVAVEVTLLYGNNVLSWNAVAAFLNVLEKESRLKDLVGNSYLSILHLLKFRKSFQKRKPIALLDAMQWSLSTLATDRRDKIFALLGMCHDGPIFVPVPNYKQSLETIIMEMSKTIMTVTRSLDLMALKGINISSREADQLPSWLPNWPNMWLNGLTIQETALAERMHTYSFPSLLAGQQDGVLKTKGLRIGLIKALSFAMKPHSGDAIPRRERRPWIASTTFLASDRRDLKCPSRGDVIQQDSVWQTLLMRPKSFDVENPHKDQSVRYCFSKLWTPEGRGAIHNLDLIDWVDCNALLKIGRWTLREWSRMNLDGASDKKGSAVAMEFFVSRAARIASRREQIERESEIFEEFIQSLERILSSGMRLACLDERTPCMVHPASKEMDCIYAIKGCSVPLVLRDVRKSAEGEQQWRVIGAAYLNHHDARWRYSFEGKEPEGSQDMIIC